MHTYIAIDLKSFYASVECVEQGLDPLTANLVVADLSRTQKTICLAVSPSLKAYGISGRARLFEVIRRVGQVNQERARTAPGHTLAGSSCHDPDVRSNPGLALDYITAPPRMALYLDYSTRIYQIYLKYIAPEDIHVYSIDEVFLDVTHYLGTYGITPRQLAARMIRDVQDTTGIPAAGGIGTNLYLCKVAMDIVAKHIDSDAEGMRIAELDELTYRQLLWDHTPLTDFWRIGHGYAKKLAANGLYTMGDIARCSLGGPEDFYNEELLYRLFGINAELLIDHAWGYEPCTMADIKAYQPENSSVGSGQVLQHPYPFEKARRIVREMADSLALDLVARELTASQLVLTIGYDRENLTDPHTRLSYQGQVTTDRYGRRVPKSAHGSVNLSRRTSSARIIVKAALELYDSIANPALFVRRITLSANHTAGDSSGPEEPQYRQLDLFTDYTAQEEILQQEEERLQREKKLQLAILDIKHRFGKNAILKGADLEEGATTRQRNQQIGGHRAQ